MKASKTIKIGGLFIFTVALLFFGIQFLKGKHFFVKENKLYAVYDNISGLRASSPVMVNGYQVGSVGQIQFYKNTNMLLVEMLINKKINIPKDSEAFIFSSDLMGSKAIKIDFGYSNEYTKSGDTLRSGLEAALFDAVTEQLAPVKQGLMKIVGSVDSVFSMVIGLFDEQFENDIKLSLSNIRMTLENLRKATGTVDTILGNEKSRIAEILINVSSISNNLKNNNEQITNILTNFSDMSDSLAKADIGSLFNRIDNTLTDVNSIVNDLKEGKGTAGQLLRNDSLYNNVNNIARDLDLLINDIKANPKKYLKISVF